MGSSPHNVSIIVPVYGDWSSLKECVESLKQNVAKTNKVMFINDCGPDVELIEAKLLDLIKNNNKFNYFRNSENLGFVRTCNRAVLELDKTKNDILLLNSDTKVTPGFLEEMSAVLYSQSKLGAISPRSNNATICTLPLSAISQKGIAPEKSYKLFLKHKSRLPRLSITPTAHGFCMLIRREVIDKYGLFDEAFGKGYGEEVDFCQRIKKDGWLCALANRAYVFHLEARSFSLETKAKLIEKSSKIISERYPEYSQNVKKYIENATAKEAEIMGVAKPSKLRKIYKRILDRFV